MRHDKLRKQGGQEDDAFRVGQVYKYRTLKQAAPALGLSKRIQIQCTCGAPLLDPQPDKIGRTGPFQHFESQDRTGEERSESYADQHDMNGQPGLQSGNRRGGAAIAVVHGGGHGVNGPGTRGKAEDDGCQQVGEPPLEGHLKLPNRLFLCHNTLMLRHFTTCHEKTIFLGLQGCKPDVSAE